MRHPMPIDVRSALLAVGLFTAGIAVGLVGTSETGLSKTYVPALAPRMEAPVSAAPRHRPEPPPKRESPLGDDPFDLSLSCSMPVSQAPRRQPDSLEDDLAFEDDLDDPLAGLRMPDLPVRSDPRVLKFVRWFGRSPEGRRFFGAALHRAGHYHAILARALREQGLPMALLAVPLIESGYVPTAQSPAGARGLWQLMPETARLYGLQVSPELDERASLWRGTDAALRHLGDLHDRFGSWDLALAAYNMGSDALAQRLDQTGLADFWALARVDGVLPSETVQYVPKVLAAALVLANADAFDFGAAARGKPIDGAEIQVQGGTRLATIARAAGTSIRRLRLLNPELSTDVVPEDEGPLTLHVPSTGLARARAMLDQLAAESPSDRAAEEVSPDFDWGRDDLTPVRRPRLERDAMNDEGLRPWRRPHRAREPHATIYYRVGHGDTVELIAQTFGMRERDVLTQAGISDPSALHEGAMLALRVRPGMVTRLQRSGEAP